MILLGDQKIDAFIADFMGSLVGEGFNCLRPLAQRGIAGETGIDFIVTLRPEFRSASRSDPSFASTCTTASEAEHPRAVANVCGIEPAAGRQCEHKEQQPAHPSMV